MSQPAKLTVLIVGSIICSVIALMLLPPVFGAGALIFGYHIYKKRAETGKIYMTVGAIAILVGDIIAVVFALQNPSGY